MLVLSRKKEEMIHIADTITITVLSVHGSSVRLGLSAPGSVSILRAELRDDSIGTAANKKTVSRAAPKAT